MHNDSFRRWRDVLAYAIIGVISVPFSARFLQNLSATVVPVDYPFRIITVYGLGGISLISTLLFLRPRLRHFRYSLSFPPTFVAVPTAGILAFAAAFAYQANRPSLATDVLREKAGDLAIASGLLSGLLVLGLAIHALLQSRPTKAPSPRQGPGLQFKDLLSLDFKHVLNWAASEAPIESPADDMFGRDSRAERILQSLRRPRPAPAGSMFPQTVVVQGPYGSGKSSVIRLVQLRAQGLRNPYMIFVELNCWGFESTTRAQEYVLTQCVEALHETVDCTCLRSVPGRYAQALSAAAPSWIFSLFEPLLSLPGPLDQIARFAPLLRLSQAQLVAVIEDTDRNGGDFDPSQIEAMLFHFRAIERMSFIVTAGPQVRIEFPKIAERIEFLPNLPKHQVLAVLDRVRDHCRTSQPFIDLVEEEDGRSQNRPKNLLTHAFTVDQAAFVMHMRFAAWPEALGRLISHPRQLKRLVNSFISAWDTLRGEVDVDELLMVIALRQSAPAAFTFLGIRLNDLHLIKAANSSDSGKDDRKKLVDEMTAAWAAVTADAEFDVEAAEILINELMPSSNQLFGPKYYTHGNRIQSMFLEGGPDYWSRLTSEALDPHEVRDQNVLRAIVAVRDSPDQLSALVDQAVASDAFAGLLGFFEQHHRLLREYTLPVLSTVHGRLRQKFGAAANDDERSYQLVRNALGRNFWHNDTLVQPWLEKEIIACFPGHLRLACDLFSFFGRRTGFAGEIRRVVRKEAERHFAGQPGIKFAQGFDPIYPWTLYHLLFAYGEKPADLLVARGEDWQFLVPVVFDGMKHAPDIMIPATLFAFGEGMPGSGMPLTHVKFREDLVAEFFGSRSQEFFLLAANYTPRSDAPKNWAARLHLAIKASKEKSAAIGAPVSPPQPPASASNQPLR